MKTTKKNTEKKTEKKKSIKPILNKPYRINPYGMVLLEDE